MASLLVFHLLGLYPVPASRQLLIGSPFISQYTLRNDLFDTSTTISVRNFDKTTLVQTPPSGSRIYVQNVRVNGVVQDSVCWIEWGTIVGGGQIEIEVGSNPRSDGCGASGNSLPASLETGGFS